MFQLGQEQKDNTKLTLTKTAYHKIREMIITNEIPAGGIISENMLTDLLGMSRTPIREALKILQRDDLVKIIRGGGTYVKGVTEKELRDLFSLRISLECLAAETAIHYIDDHQIEEMLQEWKTIQNFDHLASVNWEQIAFADNLLHRMIIYKSHNQVLRHVYDGLNSKFIRYQHLAAKSLGSLTTTALEHNELLILLKERDIVAIRACLTNHLNLSMEYITRKL